MLSPNQARAKSTPKKVTQSGHFPVKGLVTTRTSPAKRTSYKTYNTPPSGSSYY